LNESLTLCRRMENQVSLQLYNNVLKKSNLFGAVRPFLARKLHLFLIRGEEKG